MRFRPVELGEAQGKVLGHNITGLNGKRAFRKGRTLSADDVGALRELGREIVYVAELENDDVDEDQAAKRIADAVAGIGLGQSGPSTGRVNFRTTGLGVFRVDPSRLDRLNGCEGVTLATLPAHSTVRPNQITATIKIIPFAVPNAIVAQAEGIAGEGPSMIWVDRIESRSVGLIFSSSGGEGERIENQFAPLRERVEGLGSTLASVDHVTHREETAVQDLAEALQKQLTEGIDLIILAGETAIMDRNDVAPRAVDDIGGRLESLGAPVDPGNLLMLAYVGETPILGAPGCARSRKLNVVDWVLPRLLAGELLTSVDIARMGHGGLLDDLPERPLPRSAI